MFEILPCDCLSRKQQRVASDLIITLIFAPSLTSPADVMGHHLLICSISPTHFTSLWVLNSILMKQFFSVIFFRSIFLSHQNWFLKLELILIFNLKIFPLSFDKFQSPTPPPSARTPKTVSDKKRFFEHAMEDQQKPAPKSGKTRIHNVAACFERFTFHDTVENFLWSTFIQNSSQDNSQSDPVRR